MQELLWSREQPSIHTVLCMEGRRFGVGEKEIYLTRTPTCTSVRVTENEQPHLLNTEVEAGDTSMMGAVRGAGVGNCSGRDQGCETETAWSRAQRSGVELGSRQVGAQPIKPDTTRPSAPKSGVQLGSRHVGAQKSAQARNLGETTRSRAPGSGVELGSRCVGAQAGTVNCRRDDDDDDSTFCGG